ncbi:MAG: hypothetical protein II838_05185 [Lachnospiraceae bacterium]|nr:hypothetical protein [Lachnospiraceae bacterium]
MSVSYSEKNRNYAKIIEKSRFLLLIDVKYLLGVFVDVSSSENVTE